MTTPTSFSVFTRSERVSCTVSTVPTPNPFLSFPTRASPSPWPAAGGVVVLGGDVHAHYVARLLADPGIVRNRLKIAAAINNAQCFLDVQEAFGSFDDYIWRFVEGRPIQNRWKRLGQVPATTVESDALSRDLKARGFKFVGSTICYAHMQATGMVNDHLADCFRHGEILRLPGKMKK